jgi:TetR/AcrR family transcriptional regulator, regulator of autoinduction and epiphytic fitness
VVGSVKRRAYRSSIRRGDAPALVCQAAYRLFSTKGYLATSIEDIAAEAGVARPTVFTAVGPKPLILRTVVDQALAGDDAPVPIAERSWWRDAIEEPDPVRSIELYARNMCRISGRAGLVLRALEMAASIDTEAADVWARFQHQRRVGLHEFAAALAQKTTALRYDEDTITDTMWMLAPDAYLRLVHDAGWPVRRFQAWLTDTLQRMFLG